MNYSQKLLNLRTKSGETQADVAKALRIATSSIGMYERGTRVPRDKIKAKLAKHYGVSVEDIFFNDKCHIT